jgi:hypothetical protein
MTARAHTVASRPTTVFGNKLSSFAPLLRPAGKLPQRKCACGGSAGLTRECEECNKKTLMRRPDISRHGGVRESRSGTHILDPMPRSSGAPLDAATRAFFEPRFGHDFSRVRVHTDERAAQSARAVNALAYTLGGDVVFAAGRYAPETQAGRRLLAHELVHTIQQAPRIARQEGVIPAPPLDLGPGLARARQYQPRLRPHVPLVPTIAAPPIPVESTAPMPAKCPDTAAVTAALGSSDVASVTETEMARDINLAQARATGHTIAMSASILQRADTAIRAEFGSLLPSGRNLRAPGTVTQETPTQFAQTRVPDAATARERIAQAALDERGDFLRGLCITDSSNATLQTVIGGAVLKSRGLSFVRDYQAARIGGQTNYPEVKDKVSPHVTIPSESRNMGHIVVHEAMHYYVSDRYRTTAEKDPAREKSLMEGGAEFLARHVINQRLSQLPEFALHTGTYATEFHYVADNLMKAGGIDAFKQAYFQGRVGLLGLPAQPKLAISEPGDALEREADAVADEVLRMDAAGAPVDASHEVARPVMNEETSAPGERPDPTAQALLEAQFGRHFSHAQAHAADEYLCARAMLQRATAPGHAETEGLLARPISPPTPSGEIPALAKMEIINIGVGDASAQTAAPPTGEMESECSPNNALTWSDYTGKAPLSTAFSAETKVNFPWVRTSGVPRLIASFDGGNSWVKPEYAEPSDVSKNGTDQAVQACEAAFKGRPGLYTLELGPGTRPAVAKNASECRTSFQKQYTAQAEVRSKWLLKHEQGHFDISCILAKKANAALDAGHTTTEIAAALNNKKASVQDQYDTETDHSKIGAAQENWNAKIAAGLTEVTIP